MSEIININLAKAPSQEAHTSLETLLVWIFPPFPGSGSVRDTTSLVRFLLWCCLTSDSMRAMRSKDQGNKTKSMKRKTGREFDEQPSAGSGLIFMASVVV